MKREKELVRTETYMIKTLHKQVLPPTFRQIRTKPKEMIAKIPYVTSRAKKKNRNFIITDFSNMSKKDKLYNLQDIMPCMMYIISLGSKNLKFEIT